jgi:AcrR family transcriptional regulator
LREADLPKPPTNYPAAKVEGRREQKRQETFQRIMGIGLKLFIARGYEGTTLDDIAEAVGISRRTIFYYYKSKEDILMAWQGGGFLDALYLAMLEESPDQAPIDAVRHCLLKLVSLFEVKESIVVDRLLRSTEALRARKQAIFVEMEEAVLKAMCQLWPQPKKKPALHLTAMVAIGVMRVSMEGWRQDNGKRSLVKFLEENFSVLKAGITAPGI